jgi:hypothetical protein
MERVSSEGGDRRCGRASSKSFFNHGAYSDRLTSRQPPAISTNWKLRCCKSYSAFSSSSAATICVSRQLRKGSVIPAWSSSVASAKIVRISFGASGRSAENINASTIFFSSSVMPP